MSANTGITTVIASAGTSERHASLMRAIDSILDQEGVDAAPLVVLNGPNVSEDVVRELEQRGIATARLERGSLPHALHYGRQQVTTPFFSFLDDDDLYLPDTLHLRLQPLLDENHIDVVVANGFVERDGEKHVLLPDSLDLSEAPLEKLFARNWLASCGGLYRTATVSADYIREDARYFEWTMTAFLLGLDRRMHFIANKTFVVQDSPVSLSKSIEYAEACPGILKKMLAYDLPAPIVRTLKRKIAAAYHDASVKNLELGHRGKAWRYHLASLSGWSGLRYLSYTIRLFLPRFGSAD
ncbi:MAG: glycosyltransferase [Pseudomonadota bacterium]